MLLRGALLAAWTRVSARRQYRPEKHYMRGPGPKTLGMIGRRLRAETSKDLGEALPDHWQSLLNALDAKRGED
jgi:hypothetical protein